MISCQGIECCCRCIHRLEFEGDRLIPYVCTSEKPCVPTQEHGACDLWEHIPDSQDTFGKNERLCFAVQDAEKGILKLKDALEEWHDEEGNKSLQGFLLRLNLAVGHCTRALSDCADESREFVREK